MKLAIMIVGAIYLCVYLELGKDMLIIMLINSLKIFCWFGFIALLMFAAMDRYPVMQDQVEAEIVGRS